MQAGSIEIQLRADIARLQRDMDAARRTVDDATSRMGRAAGIAKGALGAIAGVLSVAAFAGWIKGAIDAADAASKLSAKTGVAVKDIAGMKLAFDLGGAGGDAMSSSMAKLSKAITEGNKGLSALGIKTQDASGHLRSNKDVLYSVADAFAKMDNGAQKTSMAMEIFGKKGADLIPLLNGGAEGFRQMDEMAQKLGLSMSKETADAAEAFNDNLDLLALGSKGVATQLAAELLPTLSTLSGSFLASMTSGDKLKKTAEFLGTGLKILYSVAVGIVEIFSTVGKILGATAAIITTQVTGAIDVLTKIAKGDLTGAWDSAKSSMRQMGQTSTDVRSEITEGWKESWKTISGVFSSEGDAAVEAEAKRIKAANDRLKAQELAEAAQRKAAAEGAASLKAANDFIAAMQLESAQIGKSGEQIKMMAAERAAAKAPTAALAKSIMDNAHALAEANRVQVLNVAAKKAAEKIDDDMHASLAATTKGIDDQIVAMKKQIENYGLTEEAVIALALTRAESERATKVMSEAQLLALDEQIEKLRVLQGLAGQKGGMEAAKQAADEAKTEWKRTAESIESSLTDALLRGFESGKGFGRNLIDTLKNMFKTLVLRPVISAIVNPVAGALTGALGLSGAAQAAGTTAAGSAAGSVAGGAAAGLGIAGTIGAIGTGALQTAGALLTGQIGMGATLSAGMTAIGTGTASGIMAGLSSVVGVLGPIALGIAAAVAIWKKLDTSGTYHTGGGAMASKDGVSAMAAEGLGFAATRINSETEKMVAGLAGGIVSILDSTATAFGKTAGYTAATAFADDSSKDGAWGGLLIKKMGETVLDWNSDRTSRWAPKEFGDGKAGQEQYLAALSASVRTALDGIGMPSWAQKMLDGLGGNASLEEMAKVVDAINQTQTALVRMGDKLVGFAALSESAVSALIAASGGIEALASNASAYYDNFYTEAEKQAEAQKQLTEAITAAGVAMPATRDEFRAAVEAQMKLGEAGAPAVAALFKASAAFAELHPIIDAVDTATTALAAAEAQRAAALDAQTAAAAAQAAALGAVRADASGLMSAVDNAFTVLQRVVAAEKAKVTEAHTAAMKALQQRIDKETASVARYRSLADLIGNTLEQMIVSGGESAGRAAAQAQVKASLAIARAGGPLPTTEGMRAALSLLSKDSAQMFSSIEDYHRDFYRTQGDIADLGKITVATLSVEEKMLAELAAQKEAAAIGYEQEMRGLDDMVVKAQSQIDLLRGIDTSLLTINQAIIGLSAAILNASKNPILAASPGINAAYQGSLGRAPDAAGMGFWQDQAAAGVPLSEIIGAIKNSPEAKAQSLFKSLLGRDGDAGGISFWSQQLAAGVSEQAARDAIMQSEEYKRLKGIPGFASGGDFGGGLRIVGENGPEIEATGPARIFNARQTASMMSTGGAELVAEVRALRVEVERLRIDNNADNRDIKNSTKRFADDFERVTDGATAMATKEVAA